MTETRSSTPSHDDPNHDTLSRFAFVETVEAFGCERFRVEHYDADAGTLVLGDADGGSSDEWRYDGTRWVCETLTEEDGTPITETEFAGADRCLDCGDVYTTDTPDEHHCGCR